MKKIAIFSLSALILAGCNNSNQPTANNNLSAQSANNAPVSAQKPNDSLIVSSHKSEKSNVSNAPGATQSETKKKWSRSGNPIETAAFDAKIAAAEKDFKTKPNDEAAKKALASAYVERGLALTDARQYASALGDYRRALKLDPANEEAKTWIDQIVAIYNSINTDYPKEGEEPEPLPFKKES